MPGTSQGHGPQTSGPGGQTPGCPEGFNQRRGLARRADSARARPQASPPVEVLRRPRAASRRDGRLLRAALLRAPRVPRAVAPRPRPPRRRVGLPRQGARTRIPRQLRQEHPLARPPGTGQRSDARDRRRRLPPLVVGVALQRARVGPEHRVRPAEPVLPEGEERRRRRDDQLGRDALPQPRGRCVRRRGAEALHARLRRQRRRRVHRLDRRVAPRRVPLPARRVLRAAERADERAGGAARCGARLVPCSRRRSRCCRCSFGSRGST